LAKKVRLDHLLVERALAPTGAKAKALIMAGQVVVNEHVGEKAGQLVKSDSTLRLKGEISLYVSRGGLKLEAALDTFNFNPTDLIAIDVGASTGGFTDCLLQRGAAKVFAIDVGYGQLDYKLQNDPRVVSLERRNFRYLDPLEVSNEVDLAVADASFISLTLLLPKIFLLLSAGANAIILVKPQFEVEKGQVGKGGVVRDESLRRKSLEKVLASARGLGFTVLNTMESPVPGAKKGNIEYLVQLLKGEEENHDGDN
jgi:23S rRNA (cytidine1920-2'-O)/16S rRNA (cytidine1409-2'-O)-methyltransferase